MNSGRTFDTVLFCAEVYMRALYLVFLPTKALGRKVFGCAWRQRAKAPEGVGSSGERPVQAVAIRAYLGPMFGWSLVASVLRPGHGGKVREKPPPWDRRPLGSSPLLRVPLGVCWLWGVRYTLVWPRLAEVGKGAQRHQTCDDQHTCRLLRRRTLRHSLERPACLGWKATDMSRHGRHESRVRTCIEYHCFLVMDGGVLSLRMASRRRNASSATENRLQTDEDGRTMTSRVSAVGWLLALAR